MHFASKITLLLICCCYTLAPLAQPRKIVYNEREIALPNQLQYSMADEAGNLLKATIGDSQVQLSWKTFSETNTSHFELQRSDNGISYEPIETITASGIAITPSNYATTDELGSLCTQRVCYRLKMVFINGKEQFTKPIWLVIPPVYAHVINSRP